MASALVKGIVAAKTVLPDSILISSKTAASRDGLCLETGARSGTNLEVARLAKIVFICVKPAGVAGVLAEIGGELEGNIVVSIAAGVPLSRIREALAGIKVELLRAMPNTGALVGKSATALCPEEGASPESISAVQRLFESVGSVVLTPENMIDAVIGVSGSGPAYVYTFFEALVDGGVLMGLPRSIAFTLALQTLDGVVEMLKKTGSHPAQLRDMITSPGGTTIAALEALEKGGMRAAVMGAVRAAAERSRAM